MKLQRLGDSHFFEVLDIAIRFQPEVAVHQLRNADVRRAGKGIGQGDGAEAAGFVVAHGLVVELIRSRAGGDAVAQVQGRFFQQGNHRGQLEGGTGFGESAHGVVIHLGVASVFPLAQIRHCFDLTGAHLHHHRATVGRLMLLQRGQQRRLRHVLHVHIQSSLNIQSLLGANLGAVVHRLPVVARHLLKQPLPVGARQVAIKAILQSGAPPVFVHKPNGARAQVGEGLVTHVHSLKHHPAPVASGPEERPGFHFLLLQVINLFGVEQQVTLPFLPGLIDLAPVGGRSLVLEVLRQQYAQGVNMLAVKIFRSYQWIKGHPVVGQRGG